MRFVLSALLFLAAACPVLAAPPDRLSFHLGSYHLGTDEEFEEFNPGLFVSWERRQTYTIGAFRNSYGDISVAGTVSLPLVRERDVALSIFGGWAYYPGEGNNISVSYGNFVPIGGVRLHYRDFFLQYIPGDGDVVDGIFSFGFSVPLRMP